MLTNFTFADEFFETKVRKGIYRTHICPLPIHQNPVMLPNVT